MKCVMLSIKPQWCEKIASGKKTIEVRKSAPKEVPFKAYIYCTKSDKYLLDRDSDGSMFCWDKKDHHYPFKYEKDHEEIFNGKVIGEFICDKVDMEFVGYINHEPCYWDLLLDGSCLTKDELMNYGKWATLYGWHISDLKIYGKPRELSEFFKPCSQHRNLDCDWLREHSVCACEDKKPVIRPPQSWMYVEEI